MNEVDDQEPNYWPVEGCWRCGVSTTWGVQTKTWECTTVNCYESAEFRRVLKESSSILGLKFE